MKGKSAAIILRKIKDKPLQQAQNAMNQQNAQNAFGLTQAAQSFLWQELRDQADYDFRWATDTANRKLQAMMSAASAEGSSNEMATAEGVKRSTDWIFSN